MKRIFLLIAMAVFLWSVANISTTAFAENFPIFDGSDDFPEVSSYMQDGIIELKEDVYIDQSVKITVETPTTVRLGDYSITIAKGCRLTIAGPVLFQGNSAAFCVEGELMLQGVSIQSDGAGTRIVTVANESARFEAKDVTITVAGDASVGIYDCSRHGTLLGAQTEILVNGDRSIGHYVRAGGEPTFSEVIQVNGNQSIGVWSEGAGAHHNSSLKTIQVSGEESIGIYCEQETLLHQFDIGVTAKDGIAVQGEKGVTLQLCRVESQYPAVFSDTGEVVLDTCLISHPPEAASQLTRTAVPFFNGFETVPGVLVSYEVSSFGFFLPVGEDIASLKLPAELRFSLYTPESELLTMVLPVTWEITTRDGADVATYSYTGALAEFLETGRVSGSAPISRYVPEKPLIMGISHKDGGHAEISLIPLTEEYETLRLWVSNDGGEHWTDYIEAGLATDWARLGFIPTDHLREFDLDYQLQLEIVGGAHAGKSPVLSYRRNPAELENEDGDRDGGDQTDQGERPNSSSGRRPTERTPQAVEVIGPPVAEVAAELLAPASDLSMAEMETEENETGETEVSEDQAIDEAAPESVSALTGPGELAVLSTALTARQVADQVLANPEFITFSQGGMKLIIPAAALNQLSLAAEEELEVLLQAEAGRTLTIGILAGAQPIDTFSGYEFEVSLPRQGAETIKQLQKDEQAILPKAQEADYTLFALTETGTYTIIVEPAPSATADSSADGAADRFTTGNEAPDEQKRTTAKGVLIIAITTALFGSLYLGCRRIRRKK